MECATRFHLADEITYERVLQACRWLLGLHAAWNTYSISCKIGIPRTAEFKSTKKSLFGIRAVAGTLKHNYFSHAPNKIP